MPSKKPLTARQTLEAELRGLHKLQASDKRIAEKAALKLANDARREVARQNTIAEKATTAALKVQARYDRAASNLAKAHARTNKGQLQRIALLESRLAAL